MKKIDSIIINICFQYVYPNDLNFNSIIFNDMRMTAWKDGDDKMMICEIKIIDGVSINPNEKKTASFKFIKTVYSENIKINDKIIFGSFGKMIGFGIVDGFISQ